ncbi:MAG: hypothetical protein WBZ36_09015, partial [Candidatus Nitrosopolaris sp.]
SFIKNASNMISSMKLRIKISMAIGLTLVLTSVIIAGPITQKAYATSSSHDSGGNLGQSKGLGGVTTGAGTAVQSGSNVGGVDPHLFCNTGVLTPICK